MPDVLSSIYYSVAGLLIVQYLRTAEIVSPFNYTDTQHVSNKGNYVYVRMYLCVLPSLYHISWAIIVQVFIILIYSH